MTKRLQLFLKGVGSVVDLAPTSRAYRFIPRESDATRLRSDLERIGTDMRRALKESRNDAKRPREQSA